MKLILVFLITSLSYASFSLPSGEYLQNGFSVSKQRVQEVVDTRYMSGLQRYEQLRGEGYNCAYAYNMIYRCVKFMPTQLSEGEVNRLNTIYNGSSLYFGYDFRVELINDAPMLIEHDVFQSVEIDIAGRSSKVKQYLSRQLSRLHKLKLDDEFEVIYDKNYDRLMLIHELRSRSNRANISKQVKVLFKK
jgi:hypothetical protein